LKEEALNRNMWTAGFGRGFGPVIRKTAKWMTCYTVFSRPLLHRLSQVRTFFQWLIGRSHRSTAKHRDSTRILTVTLFLASVLISAQFFLTHLASSSTVLRHVQGVQLKSGPLTKPWIFHVRCYL
jgi:hypothetical protein